MLGWVPPTSSKTIVFPWNNESKAFYTEFYEPEMKNDKVSLQEINQFLSDVNIECNLYKKSNADCESKSGPLCLLFVTLVVVDLFLYFPRSRDDFFGLFTNGEMIIITWFLSVFLSTFCGCIFNGQPDPDLQSQMKDKLQDLLDKENEFLRDQNFKWHLPDQSPAWIEQTKNEKEE